MLLTWNQTPEPFLSQNLESENLCICLQFCSAFFTGYWVCLKGHLSSSCKCTHKSWRIKGKSMWYCNYLLLYMATMALCTRVFWNIFVWLTWETAKLSFVLSRHCYGLFLCLCLVNAFEIILIQVQDWTMGEDMVQTCNNWWIKHLEIPKTISFPLTIYSSLCLLFRICKWLCSCLTSEGRI